MDDATEPSAPQADTELIGDDEVILRLFDDLMARGVYPRSLRVGDITVEVASIDRPKRTDGEELPRPRSYREQARLAQRKGAEP